MAPKKAIERTAASSRPKRDPKPTTVAASSAPAPKPKKKTPATKKGATKSAAPKKTAVTKVTKKTARRKAAPKKAGAAAKGAKKEAATKYQKWVVPLWVNPLGAEGERRIEKKKQKEAKEKETYKYGTLIARYTDAVMEQLKKEYQEGVAKGEWAEMGFDKFFQIYMKFDEQAWDKAYERHIGHLEGEYDIKEYKAMKKDMHAKGERGEIPHIANINDYLYWKEIDKQRAKIIEKYKADYKKEQQQQKKQQGNVSAISSPAKKAQNTIVNASPVKKAQDALTRSRSKSPEKKMLSNDSGYQADNEQQSVMSRTWELAANAVEAMRSAVNPE